MKDEKMGRTSSLKSILEVENQNQKQKYLHQEQEPWLEMSDFGPTLQKQMGMQTKFAQKWLLQQATEIENLFIGILGWFLLI